MEDRKAGGVYAPAKDTFLLLDAIEGCVDDRVLEIGVGSGAVISELAEKSGSVVGVDLDVEAVRRVGESTAFKAHRSKIELICCDSATPFRDEVFDLVVFNPPHLPSEETVDMAVDGGCDGVEVSKVWFKAASRCLRKGGRMVFVTSSLGDVEGFFKYVKDFGFEVKVLKSIRLFFEELSVVEAKCP